MHLECHAVLGWAIGNLGGGDARLRRLCTVGAVLPDIDGLSYAFGALSYAEYHHTFGHNVYAGALFCAFATARCRSWRALVLSLLSFGSHLLTDAYLSGWLLYLFWPCSGRGYLSDHAVGLSHPINQQLIYVGMASVLVLALVYRRTPIELFSPALDRLVVAGFTRGDKACAHCGSSANLTCAACGRAVCLRHALVRRRWRILCFECG